MAETTKYVFTFSTRIPLGANSAPMAWDQLERKAFEPE
jgi:hypothetical protein